MTGDADRDAALQRAIADACLAPAPSSSGGELGGFLADARVASEDVAAALAAPRRLAIYRSLVRNALSGVVLRVLPRTRARLNTAVPGRFDADFAAFLEMRGPRTHYLRDVPSELLAWVRPRWAADPAFPAYLLDLASYELAQFEVEASDDPAPVERPGEVALDLPLAFITALRVVRCRYPIHELADGNEHDAPLPREATLLAYRDPRHAVRWLELSPAAGDLVLRWVAGEPVGGAITAVNEAAQIAISEVAALLADLSARGVILGGRRAA